MRIKELTIKNFRSFKDETRFNFETSGERNIVLIGGENGAGKTSIFEAIKLCIYGPLTYKYQGLVPNYISRIKSMINEDTFIEENIESFVQLKIEININGSEDLYIIKRQWELTKGKLSEEFIIKKDDKYLIKEEQDRFQTYLKNTIPPSVFDLFFFDGEKLSDFFTEKNIDLKLKETIMTLNNFDVFNILSKELQLNIRRKDRERENLKDYVNESDILEEVVSNLKANLEKLTEEIKVEKGLIEEIEIQIHNLNEEFIKAGGLNQKTKEDIQNKISIAENKRESLNISIKEYSNDTLPFIIIRDLLDNVKEQIYLEEEYIAYNVINNKIDTSKIEDIIKKSLKSNEISNSEYEAITSELKKAILPKGFDNNFMAIHHLSREQQNKVLSIIDRVKSEDTSKIDYFEEISSLTKEIADYRKVLSQSLIDEEYERYIGRISDLNSQLNNSQIKLNELILKSERVKEQINIKLNEVRKVNEKINTLKQAENVKDMSNVLIDMIQELIVKLTADKKVEIEKHFRYIFSEIIRKEKFIDFIKLDDDFKTTLYVKKGYTTHEIIRLIANLGMDEIEKKFGSLFVEKIYKLCDSTNRKDILIYLNKKTDGNQIELNTKVDIMNLSSGEKQVYILCLYWALIKSSGIDIPFIIDTPYGRIDEIHRRAITTRFFPKISSQVVVLSTNTEIEEGLYEDISKYVSKEYMLQYNVKDRKTIINEGYFYEVI